MKPNSPAREAMEDIHESRYMEPNRDRVLGEEDRTGRHFDENAEAKDEGSEASEEHEAD
ncbi:MAG TPA: hypothetical protein VJM31_13560 [Vicinamibacterales bacterium]|nr:hypothetical protein [Vicinamibacterales bacterium]